MLRLLFASLLISLGLLAQAQEQSCFDDFMREGKQAVSEYEYQLGIRHFEAARQCPDISIAQDSIASISIIEANEIWRNSLSSALATARTEKENAKKAEKAMRLARDTARTNEQKAIAATILANRRADQAEASRLSMLSTEQTEDGSAEEALLLGLVAMDIMEDSAAASVWRAFGNAAFANYAISVDGMSGGVLEMHFDQYSWSFVARSEGGDFRFYQDDALKFETKQSMVYDVSLPNDVERNFVSVGKDSLTTVWDRNGNAVAKLSAQKSLVNGVVYDHRGESFISIGRDYTMHRWKSLTDPPILFSGHTGPIKYVEFSYGGDMILSRSLDKTAKLWRDDGSLVASLSHTGYITTVHFSPDDKSILTASTDGEVNLWDRSGGLIAQINGHIAPVSHASFAASGNQILTCSLDGTARLWSYDGRELHMINPDDTPIRHAEWSVNGKRILLRMQSGVVVICDSRLNAILTLAEYQNSNDLIEAHLSADGNFILTSDAHQAVRLWNAAGDEILSPPLFGGTVWGSGFTPDGKKIWACSEDGSAWVCTLPNLIFQGIKNGEYDVPELTQKIKRRYDIAEDD